MNKAELIDKVSKIIKLPKTQTEDVIDATLEVIQKSVSQGDEVKIVGFGVFSKVKRKPRVGRNPKTGETVKVNGSTVPRFKPGKDFKDRLNK